MHNSKTVQIGKYPSVLKYCGVLKTEEEYLDSINVLKRRNLPLHIDKPKNWDSLACLQIIEYEIQNKSSKILDAGGEYYSAILPQLSSLGYRNLNCINLSFETTEKREDIFYQKGDITNTKYQSDYFDFITCLSVIEHGVDFSKYFSEMARILRPGGLLFTSTDYWYETVDTSNKYAYGVPIKIYNKYDIIESIKIANSYNFNLEAPVDLECINKVIEWKEHQLHYTFIYFVLRKNTKYE